MDTIPFEKVTVEEAKSALNGAHPPPPSRISATDRLPHRKPQPEKNLQLAEPAFAWLAQLAKNVRPNALAAGFPRIVNNIAELWNRPADCERYLDELMLDRRGTRQGFPADAAAEIAELKHYLTTAIAPAHRGIWGDQSGFRK